MHIGNVWRTKKGTLVIIHTRGDVEDDYMLKFITPTGVEEYNTYGESRTGDDVFNEYVGNKKTHPEYFL